MDRSAGPTRPRVFVDLSTSLNLLGQKATGASFMEREIARRLLAESRICPIPVVFSADRNLRPRSC